MIGINHDGLGIVAMAVPKKVGGLLHFPLDAILLVNKLTEGYVRVIPIVMVAGTEIYEIMHELVVRLERVDHTTGTPTLLPYVWIKDGCVDITPGDTFNAEAILHRAIRDKDIKVIKRAIISSIKLPDEPVSFTIDLNQERTIAMGMLRLEARLLLDIVALCDRPRCVIELGRLVLAGSNGLEFYFAVGEDA